MTSEMKNKRPKRVFGKQPIVDTPAFKKEYPGQETEEILPPEVPDIEKVLAEPVDEAAKHQFPPPKKHPTFRRIWMSFIDNIMRRENFNIGHLNSLETLCDLYVEAEELQEFIRVKGRSYLSRGRNGEAWKFYPEVAQLKRTQAQLKDYTKMLDLVLKKDHSTESGGEKEGWE